MFVDCVKIAGVLSRVASCYTVWNNHAICQCVVECKLPGSGGSLLSVASWHSHEIRLASNSCVMPVAEFIRSMHDSGLLLVVSGGSMS